MLHPTDDLKRFSVRATDGDVGAVRDVLFDDDLWTVRYLVVDTGKWLPGRQILVSPLGIGKLEDTDRVLKVAATTAQIEQSPDIDVHQPISRRLEAIYARYYGYPYYWGGAGVWGAASYPYSPGGAVPVGPPHDGRPDPFSEVTGPRPDELLSGAGEDEHLRSCNAVRGYSIDAIDGEIGHVSDFLVADDSWTIRHLVVTTSNWWFGRKVLIAPTDVEAVRWGDAAATVSLTRESIREAPEYNPDALAEAGAGGSSQQNRIRPL